MAKKLTKKVTNTKGLTAADFMKKIGKAQGLTNLNDKKDEFYSIGDPVIDHALGGGLPKGQIYCLRGARGTGKSLISLTISRNVIEDGGNVVYFDTENKISERAIRKMGLGDYLNDQFQFLSIDTQKDAIDIIMQMIDSGIFQLIVIDSINGLYTEEQVERDIHEESKVGGYQSKVWSEYLPMLKQHAAINNSSLLLVQQARDNLQSMYGSSETYSGGKAIEHFATTILRLGTNKKGNDVVNGTVVRQGITVRIDKNNQGALPDVPIETKLYIGDEQQWGIDELTSVFNEMVRIGCLAPLKKGSAKYVPCTELCEAMGMDSKTLTFTGRAKVVTAMEGDDALYDAIKDIVKKVGKGEMTIHPTTEAASGIAVDFEDDADEDDENGVEDVVTDFADDVPDDGEGGNE